MMTTETLFTDALEYEPCEHARQPKLPNSDGQDIEALQSLIEN